MKLLIPAGGLVLACAIVASAQDTTVKSRTKVDVDEGHAVTLIGCMQQNPVTGGYSVYGTLGAAGETVKSKARVKTDVDRDGTTTRAKVKTDADDAVATSGSLSTFAITSGPKVNLSSYVGQQVQLAAVIVDPHHKDAEVKVTDKTKVDPEHGRSTESHDKAKIEVDRTVPGQYTVVSVKPLGTCAGR